MLLAIINISGFSLTQKAAASNPESWLRTGVPLTDNPLESDIVISDQNAWGLAFFQSSCDKLLPSAPVLFLIQLESFCSVYLI